MSRYQVFNDEEAEAVESPIGLVTDSLKDLLLYKNEKYGNSALEPLNIFSKQSAENSVAIRLDDKLSRIKNSKELRKNDVADLLGYLVLLCVSKDWLEFSEFKD